MTETVNMGGMIEPGESYNPPSAEEIEKRMVVLYARGLSIVFECYQCGEPD